MATRPAYTATAATALLLLLALAAAPGATARSLKAAAATACNGCADAACYCKTVASGDYANPFDATCATFLKCANGAASVSPCPGGLIFNAAAKVCDWPTATTCSPGCAAAAPSPSPKPSPSPSPSPSPAASPSPSPSPSPKPSPSPSPTPAPSPSPSPATGTACNGCADAACYCKTVASGDYANPFDATCATFLKCAGGAASIAPCPGGLIFNTAAKVCDWPTATTCNPGCATVTTSPSPSPVVAPSPSPTVAPSPSPVVAPSPSPSPAPSGPAPANALLPSGPIITGYYQTWSAPWKSSGASLDLANIPAYVNVVVVSFAQPDCTYVKGSYVLSGTGLSFSSDALVVRDAISALKARQPNTRVLLAVGGATYTNFAALNAQCVKDLVTDFGFDGADLDWEPSTAACAATGGKVSCPTDAEGVAAVTALREKLPKGQYLLSTASFHVGVYGEGAFAASKPASGYMGINLAMARSPAGQSLDLINIMSYDAGNLASTGFDPKESLRAHRAAWPTSALALGVEVPPEAWGGNVVTLDQVADLSAYTMANGGNGMMIWSLHKGGSPSAQAILTKACTVLGMAGCTAPLPM
ncbi:MAG: glycoside hydrolase superfamily [Monoraphidium minutum]|nr:MAG: glycoside hydrolase superfamily [Monoraphidium minutum]